MTSDVIHSAAFRRATMRSERNRIIGLIVVILLLWGYAIVRDLTLGTLGGMSGRVAVTIVIAAALAYEAVMLVLVVRAMRRGGELSGWSWGLNVIIEPLFPTLGLVFLTLIPEFGPYRALVSPLFHVYYFFIILSVLHLNLWLCRLNGLVAGVAYAAVVWWTFAQYPGEAERVGAFARPIYLTFSIFLVMAGFIAGLVADVVRHYVRVSVRETSERERLARDLDIAREIQQGLLPEEAITVAGFEIAGWNRPADETGGDYFDWQRLADGRVAVTLADVTGHGIGPALVTAVCRAYSRASLSAHPDLASLMDRINHLLVEDLPEDRFITLVMAVIDPASGQVEMLSAGHGPQLFYAAVEGSIEHFGAHGIPLGVMVPFEYDKPQVLTLAKGDVLMLMTDGFFEWMSPAGEIFGLERLRETFASLADRSPAEIIEALYERVRAFADGAPQRDDVTAVVIKRVE